MRRLGKRERQNSSAAGAFFGDKNQTNVEISKSHKKGPSQSYGILRENKIKVRLDVRYCYTDATTLTSNGLPKDEIRNTTINLQHRSVATFVGNYYCVDTILGTADIALLRRQSAGHIERSIDCHITQRYKRLV